MDGLLAFLFVLMTETNERVYMYINMSKRKPTTKNIADASPHSPRFSNQTAAHRRDLTPPPPPALPHDIHEYPPSLSRLLAHLFLAFFVLFAELPLYNIDHGQVGAAVSGATVAGGAAHGALQSGRSRWAAASSA